MLYFTKTPVWVKKLFTGSVWEMPKNKKAIYLTFDDGPHPEITPFVLELLGKYNAKATFFCIGKNVKEYPIVFNQILNEGHAIGNHTYDHLNGWKTRIWDYITNTVKAGACIQSDLFRPPYGKITRSQHIQLTNLPQPYKIVMWSVLSGDFDHKITAEQCCKNVINNAKSGSVVVFHDSEKAMERLQYALPKVLSYFSEKGFAFEKIVLDS